MYCWVIGGCKVADTATERMLICKKCDWYDAGTCNKCGCILELKTKMKTEKCPLDKW